MLVVGIIEYTSVHENVLLANAVFKVMFMVHELNVLLTVDAKQFDVF